MSYSELVAEKKCCPKKELSNIKHLLKENIPRQVWVEKSLSTVWSSDLYTLLMRYEVNLTPYRIKSVYKSLDQTVLNIPIYVFWRASKLD